MTLEPGNVVECRVNGSFRYAQLFYLHPSYREIVGLDPTQFEAGVTDLAALNFSQTLIFPLSEHLQSGDLKGRVRTDLRSARPVQMPRFKFAIRDNTGEALYWWVWDGDGIEIASPDDDLDALPNRCTTPLVDVLKIWG